MTARLGILVLAVALAGPACIVQEMADQPSKTALEASELFTDGGAARRPVPGTVARGDLEHDVAFRTGRLERGGARFVSSLPVELDMDLLRRGQERYDIFCSPCHDRTGSGQGMVVLRGYRQPTSFHSERVRQQPVGYLVDVMANGFGVMPSYAAQVPPRDRWAIAAYIRALQLSQHATVDDVPVDRRGTLGAAPPPGELESTDEPGMIDSEAGEDEGER